MDAHLKSLDEIAISHGTDKASVFTRTYAKPHDYCRHLERFFEPMRNEPIRLLEIGVGGGESIQTWVEYFVNGMIVGVDIVHDTNPWNTPSKPNEFGISTGVHGRYEFFAGDSTQKELWVVMDFQGWSEFDMIIDDGSHMAKDVIETHNLAWPKLKSGGLYIIEDLEASYSAIFQSPGWPTPIERIRGLIDAMNHGQGDVDSIYLAKELAVIRKK